MDSIGTWLASIAYPIVTRVLASLGFGFLSFSGATTAFDSAISYVQSLISGLPSDLLNIINMAGLFDFMAITSGGVGSGLAWMLVKRLAVVATSES